MVLDAAVPAGRRRVSGVLARVASRFRDAITESHELATVLRMGYGTAAGAVVTWDSALTLGAVYSCVRVRSETLGQVPLHLMKRTANGRERELDHPVARLLEQPNAWQTPFEWKEMTEAHCALAGNAYSLKTVVRGETRELLPIPPSRVRVEQLPGWGLQYHVTMPDGRELSVPRERILHIPGLSWNGVTGLSVLAYMRETIGIGLQQAQFAGRLYSNGATLRGVIKHPKTIGDEAQKRLRAQFDEVYGGVENAHKMMLLEEGAEFQKTGMTAEDAQFLESRRATRLEVAAWFRVPPHLIGEMERATFSNIEHQSLEFVMYSIAPSATRLEQRLARDLLSDKDRAIYYPKFVLQGLLRGDFKTRMEGYSVAIQGGWMNRNEVRELEDMNRVPGLDEYLVPLNMGRSSDPPEPPPEERLA